MKEFSVFIDGEWYFEGTYEQCEEVAHRWWADPEFYGVCEIVANRR